MEVLRSGVWLLAAALLVGGCSDEQAVVLAPLDRAVTIETEGCGFAPKGTGSGVVVNVDRIVTAAHVVIGASEIRVTSADGTVALASIIALDPDRDVAVVVLDRSPVEVDGTGGASAVAFARTESTAGDPVRLVGGASSGTLELQVQRRVRLDVDTIGVAGERSVRQGYELKGTTASGDSGGGIYDESDRLVGIVFASSVEDGSVTWATAAHEVAAVLGALEAGDGDRGRFRCDPDRSKVIVR